MEVTEGQLRQAARLACFSAYAAYAATLRGDVPVGSYKNFDPVVGHPVVEYAMSRLSSMDVLDCIGVLERNLREPRFSQEEWNENGDGPERPIPDEEVWYIRTLDGREVRWTNALFIRVPDSADFRAMNPIRATV